MKSRAAPDLRGEGPRNGIRTVPQLDDVAATERSTQSPLAHRGPNLRTGERRTLRGGEVEQSTGQAVLAFALVASGRADGGGHRRSLAHLG
jgi:hypothetical protein